MKTGQRPVKGEPSRCTALSLEIVRVDLFQAGLQVRQLGERPARLHDMPRNRSADIAIGDDTPGTFAGRHDLLYALDAAQCRGDVDAARLDEQRMARAQNLVGQFDYR